MMDCPKREASSFKVESRRLVAALLQRPQPRAAELERVAVPVVARVVEQVRELDKALELEQVLVRELEPGLALVRGPVKAPVHAAVPRSRFVWAMVWADFNRPVSQSNLVTFTSVTRTALCAIHTSPVTLSSRASLKDWWTCREAETITRATWPSAAMERRFT